jgi:chromosomal replication initiator protein
VLSVLTTYPSREDCPSAAEVLWQGILDGLRERVSTQKFQTWFAPMRAVGMDPHALRVEVPNAFFIDWIEEHFLSLLNDLAGKALGAERRIEFTVAAGGPPEEPPPALMKVSAPAPSARAPSESCVLHQRFTFETFVVGKSNELARAACQAVADKLASAYNPLFIYGGVGLGKTHLLHAIGNAVHAGEPRRKILYLSAETFMNQLVHAIQHGTTLAFKERYRSADLLLIDDIQFLAGKETTQEEFFHTFNSLYDAHKQIVLTSDRPPRDMAHVEDRLISRFHWGLVTHVEPPDFETRLAILMKKSAQDGLRIPQDVLEMIAGRVRQNIRELEGCLARLSALASLTGREIDVPFAQEELRDFVQPAVGPLDAEAIRRVVARHYGVTEDAMRGKRRTSGVALARQVAMYVIRKKTNLSYVEIGRRFGDRDHSTVLFAVRKIEKLQETDADIGGALEQIEDAVETVAAR